MLSLDKHTNNISLSSHDCCRRRVRVHPLLRGEFGANQQRYRCRGRRATSHIELLQAPNIADFLPVAVADMIIDYNAFRTPEKLSAYLAHLNADDAACRRRGLMPPKY